MRNTGKLKNYFSLQKIQNKTKYSFDNGGGIKKKKE